MKQLTYADRIAYSQNPTAQKLLATATEKQSNLILSLDLTKANECLKLLEKVGEHICMVKTHIDIMDDFTYDYILALQELARAKQFIIFEDRKFADIGNTMQLQYQKGIYHIADWAQLITVHAVAGLDSVTALKEIGLPKGNAAVLLAEMSSKGNLLSSDYREQALSFARAHSDFIIGLICLRKLLAEPNFLHFTPGVQLQSGTDRLGQQYLTPEQVIYNQESDFIIVGRGIYAAADPVAVCRQYQTAGWQAYCERLRK